MMSIFGATKDERWYAVRDSLRICDDCGYDGTGHNPDTDVCDQCGENTHPGGDDICEHCGAANCLMMACPECCGRLSLDYDRMQPMWDAHRAFGEFDRRAQELGVYGGSNGVGARGTNDRGDGYGNGAAGGRTHVSGAAG